MPAPTLDETIADFLAQRRIAVAGVSTQPARHPVGAAVWRRLRAAGHQVFAINPNQTEFEGEPCWPDVASIPGGVDAVFIATRPEITLAVTREALAAGVRRVWMHASGAGPTSVSDPAVALCREQGAAVIAGACPMMYGPGVDFGHKCMKWMLKLSGGLPASA